jgi:hypothetical protein
MKNRGDADEPAVSEDDCVVCGSWPERDRWALREMIDTIPLSDDVCDECNMAFWRNCIVPLLPKPTKPTRH